MRAPNRPPARRRQSEPARREPVPARETAPVPAEAQTARPDAQDALGWLRREFAGLHARLANLSDRVARQEAALTDVAGEQASEMNVTLAELEGCAAELRTESQHLRDLREAMTEAVPPMVDAAARHAVATTTSGLAAEMRSALASITDSLPAMIEVSVQEAVGAAVEQLQASVQQVVSDSVTSAVASTVTSPPPASEAPTKPPPAPVEVMTPPIEPPVVVGETSPLVDADPEPGIASPESGIASPEPEPAGPEPVHARAEPVPATPEVVEPSPSEPLPGIDEAGVLPAPDSLAVCALPGLSVGPTLALDLSRALARARIRRRRLRQAAPPTAGLHRQDPFAGRVAGQLERFALARADLAYERQEAADGRGGEEGVDHALSLVAAGERDGRELALSIDVIGGLSIVGPDALDACRALLATFLARAEPPAAEVAVVADLLAGAPDLPGVARVATIGPVLDRLEPEIARRSRLISEAGVPDVAAYKARYPHELLPLLVVATREAGDPQRLQAVIEKASGLGVAFLLADVGVEGATTVQLQPGAVVQSVTPAGRLPGLVGARLFTMGGPATAEVLAVLAGARTDHQVRLDAEVGEAPFPVEKAPDPAPIQVSLLGSYRIEVGGQEIRSGLRAKARELLAFYLLHPEGTTLDAATEALWPEADAGRGSEWFWTALGNLRSLLRNAIGQRELKVIERYGDQYRIEPLFDVDLWRFQEALGRAGKNGGDAAWATALQEAADLYRGDLLADADWAWAQVPRDDLRRRAVDILVSLAASRQVGGDVRGALGALQQAVQVDPLAEQLYRRIMRLYSRLSRPDDVAATFQQLKNRLAEVGLEPTSDSTKLSVELSAN